MRRSRVKWHQGTEVIRVTGKVKCPLCGLEMEPHWLQAHHLKTRRKDFQDTEDLCVNCHKTIHGLFSNQELRDPKLGLDSVEGLLENERMKKALEYIRKKNPGEFIKTKQSKHKH